MPMTFKCIVETVTNTTKNEMQLPNGHIITLLIELHFLINQHHYFQKQGHGLICQNVCKKQAFAQYTYLSYNSLN
jgi:hypothetical protein